MIRSVRLQSALLVFRTYYEWVMLLRKVHQLCHEYNVLVLQYKFLSSALATRCSGQSTDGSSRVPAKRTTSTTESEHGHTLYLKPETFDSPNLLKRLHGILNDDKTVRHQYLTDGPSSNRQTMADLEDRLLKKNIPGKYSWWDDTKAQPNRRR
jgi:hypothetical protein